MAFCVGSVLVLSVLSLIRVRGEVSVDCGRSSVSVRWTDSQSLTDPWFLRLGSCLPSSISVRPGGAEAIFYARFDDCSFRRLVTEDEIVFENELSTEPSTKNPSGFFSPIVCVYERPADWRPPMYDPMLFLTNGKGDLVFHMNFMKEDFSGVATSTTFPLGSLISIAAAVEQQAHQPLVLLLEECVASTTPELEQSNKIYPIIANKGCLIESKKSNSRFLPRRNPSEIRMYLQAFKFALGEDVYIHCKLVAWDPKGLDNGRKACHYDKNNGRWELLDNVLESGLCACCDTQCRTRNKRELNRGIAHPVVLGPLTITD
ncbi:zona pellucida sperm-binding protein 3 [Astyanax mexicanus]|uniref:zona pellucida sperm-binding protein 3 n=1 Tax=Astyanax mexicanus TaxID=7994 RepID=UPI0020CB1BA3|nr:zona pellucida sperm-binding protein 3 [Astyanax mexicanus]